MSGEDSMIRPGLQRQYNVTYQPDDNSPDEMKVTWSNDQDKQDKDEQAQAIGLALGDIFQLITFVLQTPIMWKHTEKVGNSVRLSHPSAIHWLERMVNLKSKFEVIRWF